MDEQLLAITTRLLFLGGTSGFRPIAIRFKKAGMKSGVAFYGGSNTAAPLERQGAGFDLWALARVASPRQKAKLACDH